MYIKTYTGKGQTVSIDGFERSIILPDMPPEKDMVNYKMATLNQKFRREPLPRLNPQSPEMDRFAKEQWHKRINGEWIMVKGRPIYLTGPAWTFFNYWQAEYGGFPDFRMEAVEFFWIWEWVLNNKQCFGLFDIKCRRLGDTEKAIFCGYELATRYRNSWFGQQNISEEDAKLNYKRITLANKNMPVWFAPKYRGSDEPEQGLVFKYQPRAEVARNTEAAALYDEIPELNSRIDYKSTRARAYDGKRLRFYHLDEIGKISPKEMNGLDAWGVVRQCLALNNEQNIVGKAILSTTVEDIDSGGSVKVCSDIWRQSDPNVLSDLGRTTSGLIRVFRGYKNAAPVDEWGFHKVEEAARVREAQIRAYLNDGNVDALAAYKRKTPATVEEALVVPATQCVMYPALLDAQKMRVEEGSTRFYPVCGDFHWSKGFGSDVVFSPSPSGKFFVSGHPDRPNMRDIRGTTISPGNSGAFTIGVDPYDHVSPSGSDGGGAVFSVYNPLLEDALIFDEVDGQMEIMNKEQMKTNRFVCTYRNRPYDPDEFYEDMLKCAIYYGVSIFVETDKPGIMSYFRRHGYHLYLMFKPKVLGIGAKNQSQPGIKATTASINTWVPMLKTHLYNYILTYCHLNQIADFRQFTGDNRSECDLLVASGHAIMAANAHEIIGQRKQSKGWGNLPVRYGQNN